MSEEVTYVGKLTLIKKLKSPEEVEDFCRLICESEEYEVSCHDTFYEHLVYDLGTHICANNTLYSVTSKKVDSYKGQLTEVSHNQYEFITTFYNGGCSLPESLEELLIRNNE